MKFLLTAFVLSTALLSSTFVAADEAGRFAPLTEFMLKDGRDVVATADGKVAYTFDVDDVSISNCYDGCAKTWPPILAKSAEGLVAPIGAAVRKDGTLQLTLDGQPLYFFIGDKNPGDIKGDGLGNVWHIIVD